jgi:hypothetical protein
MSSISWLFVGMPKTAHNIYSKWRKKVQTQADASKTRGSDIRYSAPDNERHSLVQMTSHPMATT